MRIDGRTLDHTTLETFRKLAVQRVLDGKRPAEVVRSLGMNRTSIYRWISAYRQTQSLSALDAHKSPGPAFTLSPAQERQLFAWLNGHTPHDYLRRPCSFALTPDATGFLS
jgi:transposase